MSVIIIIIIINIIIIPFMAKKTVIFASITNYSLIGFTVYHI